MPEPLPFDVRLDKEFAKRARLLGKMWKSETIRLTRGPILKIRSGRLNRNIFMKRGVDYYRGKHYIEVGTRAMNPRDNFPYGAWHEFGNLRVWPREPVVIRLGNQYANKLAGKGAGGTGRAYILHGLDRAMRKSKFKSLYPTLRKEMAKSIRASFRP